MWTDVIFPYAHEADCLDADFDDFVLDDESIKSTEVKDPEQKTISFFHIEKQWNSISLKVAVRSPKAEFAKLLSEGAAVKDTVDCWILVRNAQSRLRIAEKLEFKNGAWSGSLTLKRADIRRETAVSAVCVLSKNVDATPGLAVEKGESIATSPVWRLYVDEPAVMPGGGMNSEWVKFSASPHPELRSKSDCVWHIDYDGREPKLLLNEAIPGIRQALSLRGTGGIGYRIKETLIHSLTQGVLLELCTISLMELESTDHDESSDWRLNLLDYIAGAHREEESDKVCARWIRNWHSPGNTASSVLSEVSTCIQRTLQIAHSSEYLIKIHEARSHHEHP